jgi:hypothetical protein
MRKRVVRGVASGRDGMAFLVPTGEEARQSAKKAVQKGQKEKGGGATQD